MASQKLPFKSQALGRDLAVRLKNRGIAAAVSEDLDSDRFPVIKLEDGAGDFVWIHITTDHDRQAEDGSVDGLGLAQRTYTPHVINILKEVFLTSSASIETLAALATAECAKLGTKLVVRDGTAVKSAASFAAADAAATNVAATYESDDVHPLTQQM